MSIIEKNISIKNYNTFAINAYADLFAAFNSIENLKELLQSQQQIINNRKNSILILGGGSNLLFTRNFDGLILKNEIKGIKIIKEDEHHIYIQAGAGENWHQFVLFCIEHNLAGVENLSLIPGNVGASPMQNIGAYGVEIKDVFHSLEAYHIHDKKMVNFTLNDCEFGYRESVFKKKFKNEFVIMDVTFRLNRIPNFNISYGAIGQELEKMGVKDLSLQAVSQAVINIRSSKLPDPAVIGNAGSFFKNPEISGSQFAILSSKFPGIVGYDLPNGNVKLAAGWLIEQCGWKGYRKGDAGCHEKQALVLVNYGHATGTGIYDLSEEILQSVNAKFGVELEREVNIV
ncbi:MAG: UDP-N-acetylmuramate dehydrogenase [Chitinophagaceae bacterium]|nr:UDP-N-acetylmuramate dehydrogenase [Chitinophagaceae bacterium]MBL0202488.1 UDP-N-acetylmuramate dehydrogenase [Chitinophagaceae bacterium]